MFSKVPVAPHIPGVDWKLRRQLEHIVMLRFGQYGGIHTQETRDEQSSSLECGAADGAQQVRQ